MHRNIIFVIFVIFNVNEMILLFYLGQSTIAAEAALKQGASIAAKEGTTATSRVVGWWMAGCAGKEKKTHCLLSCC